MTEYDVNVNANLLPDLLSQSDGIAKLFESVLNQVLEAQVNDHLQAKPYERSEERVGYRNGYRPRTLYTRVGPVTLQVPQTRDGSFSTEVFHRYQRSEQAFVLGLMEMAVNGVSTRKVTQITEELCGTSFSKSTVSRLCGNLDARVSRFNNRVLENSYPFVIVDALFTKAREDDRVVSKAVLVATGINAEGQREVLGVRVGDSESYSTWEEMFGWLRRRGLKGVRYLISDAHSGLVEAVQKQFHGVTWQRCQVHLMRNIMGHCSRRVRKEVVEDVQAIFAASSMAEARRLLTDCLKRYEKAAPKAMACLEDAFDDAMAIMTLPVKYRKRLRSTNMLERVNEELRRRERVIRIFPNEEAVLRMMGALLAEYHEQWQERKYLDMDEFNDWVNEQNTNRKNTNLKAIK